MDVDDPGVTAERHEFLVKYWREQLKEVDASVPQHRVVITKSFHLGVYDVTQQEFKKVMGFNPRFTHRFVLREVCGVGSWDRERRPGVYTSLRV